MDKNIYLKKNIMAWVCRLNMALTVKKNINVFNIFEKLSTIASHILTWTEECQSGPCILIFVYAALERKVWTPLV